MLTDRLLEGFVLHSDPFPSTLVDRYLGFQQMIYIVLAAAYHFCLVWQIPGFFPHHQELCNKKQNKNINQRNK